MAKSKMLKIEEKEVDKPYAMLYLRVSTDRQAEEGYSIDIQKDRLGSYVKSMFGDKDVQVEYFIDDGYSGGSLDRPAMQRMIETIKGGEGTHVIVYKLDRLSRSQKDTLYLIEDVFLTHNIAFISMQESFNTATPFGRAVIGILSVFAQLERENIYERTRSGMQKRVESGLWMGGGHIPFGYDYDRQRGILVPNKDADTVRLIYKEYLEGKSLQVIANEVGLKYDKLAYQILTRKSNAGYIVYNGVEYKGQHEPIISLEIYERAMALLKERSLRKTVMTTDHLLTGLVYCGVCGAKMRYVKWGKRGFRFMCYSKEKTKKYLVKDPDCDNETFDAIPVENAVIEDLFRLGDVDLSDVAEAKETLSVSTILNDRYDALSNKLKRLYKLYAESADDILLETIQDIKKEMEDILAKLKVEEERSFWTRNIERTKQELKTLPDTWERMTITEKRSILRTVIDSITITHSHIDIKYKF